VVASDQIKMDCLPAELCVVWACLLPRPYRQALIIQSRPMLLLALALTTADTHGHRLHACVISPIIHKLVHSTQITVLLLLLAAHSLAFSGCASRVNRQAQAQAQAQDTSIQSTADAIMAPVALALTCCPLLATCTLRSAPGCLSALIGVRCAA
jgi:hypothetical protein